MRGPRVRGHARSLIIQSSDREATKKIIGKTVLATVLGVVSTTALAVDPGAFFINGNISQSHYHDQGFNDRTDTSAAVRAGYVWHVGDASDVGVEAGYANLGQATDSLIYNFNTVYIKAKLTGPVIGANYKYKFSNKMFLSIRAGWFRSKFDVSSPGLASQSFSGNGAYSGVGVGYDFTQHFGLGVNFDEYHGRATVYGTKSKEGVSAISGFAEYRY